MEIGFRRERRRPIAEMNVVPYIDVMLVLLVIFMVTAPMLTQGLQVDLPQASADTIPLKQQDPVVVSIKADGSYWLRIGEGAEHHSSLEQIIRHVEQQLDAHPDLQLLINGDRRVDYGAVIQLMGKLQQSGIHNIGLLTTTEQEPPRT